MHPPGMVGSLGPIPEPGTVVGRPSLGNSARWMSAPSATVGQAPCPQPARWPWPPSTVVVLSSYCRPEVRSDGLGRSYAAGAPNLVGVPKRAAHEIERYFSIVQRKALSPDSFDSLDALADRLLGCGGHDRQIARPFDWTFTRADLERVLAKVTEREPRRALAAQRTEIAWPSRGSRVLPEGVDDLPFASSRPPSPWPRSSPAP